MFPRRLFPWLFGLTLLFGQAAAFAHVFTHLHAQESGMPDTVCEICVAQANLGNAAPAAVSVLPVEAGRPAEVPAGALPPAVLSFRAAQARAPPAAI